MRSSCSSIFNPLKIFLTNIRSISSDNVKSPIRANLPSGTWALGKLNHIAVAVPNLNQTSGLFKDVLHAKSVSGPVPQDQHGIHTVAVDLDNTKIELLYPLGEKSPIKKFLEKKSSGGIHHICFEVNNLDAAIKDIHRQNIRTLSPTPEIGDHGKAVIYLHPKDCAGLLIELQQA